MKVAVAAMSALEAGRFLRDVAEATARASQNWNNFQVIATDLIKAAYDAGHAAQRGDAT